MNLPADNPATDPLALRTISDAVCPACGCVCDDIDLVVRGQQVVEARRACQRGAAWLVNRAADLQPECTIDGREVTQSEAIARAAEILTFARYPLVYGLTETTCEAQRLAVSIADWIGGTLDTPTSACHGPTGMAFHGIGEITCSLGEITHRADLVIFWGADPAVSHPRHTSKYSLDPVGLFVPGGRAERTCVAIDVHPTATADLADHVLQIPPGRDFEVLWVLRALARDLPLNADDVERDTGVSLDRWQDLMERMKRARFGAVLFGRGLSMSRGKHLNIEALMGLVRDLNEHTHFAAMSLREHGNVNGADNVVCWSTGFPFGVNLSRGYPRYNPGEFTADALLERREVDAALIVATDPQTVLSPTALARLAAIPRVFVGAADTPFARAATVRFATAAYGVHAPGTVYRMDDVPLYLRVAVESERPSDADVLTALEVRVRHLTAARTPSTRSTT
jgi:formylmethanofuran dehydrogenase subunit B